jgi:hypothetical protein
MNGDKIKFISLNRKGGNVSFGYDSSSKILRKEVVEFGSENVKENNILLVEDIKHNLLSVSKMCDQGEEYSGRLVVTSTRRPSNI